MPYTISTHNGHSVARQHNLRNRKVTDKEDHIDRSGHHETWRDIKPEDAYHILFDESISEYNKKQREVGHPERQIQNYYKKICNDPKKHPVYEMIISIGSKDNRPSSDKCRKIFRKFCKGWKTRNPNLKLIGVYFHDDEEGTPHCHLDYIPVVYHPTRGPSVQTALVKSLNEQGLFTDNIHDTAQIKFERQENLCLEELCQEADLEIIHPHVEKTKHLKTEEYKQHKINETLINENDALKEQKDLLEERMDNLKEDLYEIEHDILEKAEAVIERKRNKEYDLI